MTPNEIDALLLQGFEPEPDQSIWFIEALGYSLDSAGEKPRLNELTLQVAIGLLRDSGAVPPSIGKLRYPKRQAWLTMQVRWSLKRLELQGLIEQVADDRWRKLSVLEQLARAGNRGKRKKFKP